MDIFLRRSSAICCCHYFIVAVILFFQSISIAATQSQLVESNGFSYRIAPSDLWVSINGYDIPDSDSSNRLAIY
ncbi:hypothetical protein [Psychromonas sp. MME2]|uniref:hypothetical protein n=1 Tax=Psychromonas sp. MME2 TaxID=3231033 RepID=UPI00339C5F5C